MRFDTQRLRVQIPCKTSGSVINTADFCGEGNHRSLLTLDERAACRIDTRYPTDPACGPGSDIIEGPWTELLNTEHITERYVLEPEDLPRLRELLELRLRALSVVADAAAAARRRVKANLSDVEATEKTLRNMSNG